MSHYWSDRYADRIETLTSSAIRELLKLTQQPEVISFAGGLPASEFFPLDAFEKASSRLLHENGEAALQYSTTEGYLLLREMIARHAGRYGIEAGPENILITTGSQQALDLLGKLFINKGDSILVERPSYLGAIQAFKVYGPDFHTLPLDEQGMQVDGLEQALARGPKFLYLLPNFHNPAGVTLSAERREKIALAARQAKVPIIEDDPYGQLRYEGEHKPAVFALDRDARSTDGIQNTNVIYMSSFSKVLTPGLRLGWVIAPTEVIGRLVQLKQGADLHSSTFCQMLAYEVASDGFLDENIQFLREVYRDRRDAMLNALAEHMPDEVSWTKPQGGLFLWLRLPEYLDSKELLAAALEENVAFVPGSAFYTEGEEGRYHCRLNFSCSDREKIELGIQRLGNVIREQLAEVTTSAKVDKLPT
ncbi:MAG: PLP-dependent aminotransferase family protein [Anaerolineales bacterium]